MKYTIDYIKKTSPAITANDAPIISNFQLYVLYKGILSDSSARGCRKLNIYRLNPPAIA